MKGESRKNKSACFFMPSRILYYPIIAKGESRKTRSLDFLCQAASILSKYSERRAQKNKFACFFMPRSILYWFSKNVELVVPYSTGVPNLIFNTNVPVSRQWRNSSGESFMTTLLAASCLSAVVRR